MSSPAGFLFPVRALSRVFRGKYLDALRQVYDQGQLTLTGTQAELNQPASFAAWLSQRQKQDWVVYCKPPLAGPAQVLDYLGRYTHRVAISHHRLVDFDGERVSFRWRDSAHHNKQRILSLDGEEFLRRFLLHILPSGFQRIRHYGLFANRGRRANLDRCRQALGQSEPVAPVSETPEAFMLRVAGIDIHQCPYCHQGRLQLQASLLPQRLTFSNLRPP